MESKPMPQGSSAFAKVMSDFQDAHLTPIVEISDADEVDGARSSRRRSSSGHHHEEGMMVHGLHHCYKVESGHCLTSFRCNHDHHRLSSGHLEEMTPAAANHHHHHHNHNSPGPIRRRVSIATTGGSLLSPEEEFRLRSNSDAARRGSVPVNTMTNGSEGAPKLPKVPARRGSNVVLHSEELHYVYDQYLHNK